MLSTPTIETNNDAMKTPNAIFTASFMCRLILPAPTGAACRLVWTRMLGGVGAVGNGGGYAIYLAQYQ
jgi:hypothetical protein